MIVFLLLANLELMEASYFEAEQDLIQAKQVYDTRAANEARLRMKRLKASICAKDPSRKPCNWETNPLN